MTQKFKVGDKVRVINPIHSVLYNGYNEGDVFQISAVFSKAIETVDGPRLWFHEVEKVPKKSERISALEAQVAELTAKVEALEKQPKPTDIAEMFALALLNAQKPAVNFVKIRSDFSTNEERKAIIEEAKAFVDDVTERMNNGKNESEGNNYFSCYRTIAEFNVNAEKRRVVALVKGARYPHLYSKGIAKCAPDDVFNADIGKAIALGRALGLNVKRFEQAVKPSELVVGHVVTKVNGPVGNGRIYKVVDGKAFNGGPGSHWSTNISNNTTLLSLDDTDAQY